MDRDRRLAYIRIGLFAAFVGALFIAVTISGELPSASKIRDWGESLGPAAPVLFIPLSAVLSCLFVPGPALAGAAGLLFGTPFGTPLALLSATLAACMQLLVARHLAGKKVEGLLPERVRRFDDFIESRGFLAVLYMRLTPGVPYVAVNYGAGLTRLRLRDMAAGTLVGALPRTFAYVALGGSLTDLGSPEAIAALAMLVVFAIGGALFARRGLARERE
ncbi:MAG: TVP38/TMEM64 family protein [Thermoleophilaceae bacterium]|nr:TVP38/TMEM64 family protein [Thermoleophilaceae bacterium]